ncbi:MAG: hypothetical protein ACFE0Q_18750 [Anaerolineae bacterium]
MSVKKVSMSVIAFILLIVGQASAQNDTEGEPTSTVFYLFAACESEAVFDLTGTIETGYDLYVQVFDQVGGGGTALTPLTRVSVSGDYEVSQVLPYNNARTLLVGQFASATIAIARENDPSSTIYTDIIDDVRDTCIEPAYSSTDTFTSGQSTSSTPLVDPVTGNIIGTGEVIASSGIFTPDGGVLNEVFSQPQEALVQIGARPSDIARTRDFEGRVSDPGLIFAECDAFPLADPGRVWDTDNITIFWSWFAATPELAQQHVNNAQYEVFLSSEYVYRQPFPRVDVSQPVLREDGNYYVFYTANLGNGFRPGEYRVDFYVTWETVIDDGYELFGPGTDNTSIINTCTFEAELNPFGINTPLNNPTVPLQR